MNIPAGDLDVLAIGEIVVDMISVEETEDLRVASAFRRYQGGSPANLAVNIARLGGQAALIAKVGAGAFGRFLRAELARSRVATDYLVVDPERPSTVIFISRTAGTADSLAYRGADYHLRPEEIAEEAIRRAKVVHASTFALSRQPCRSAVERAFHLARQQGKIISLDPNYNPPVWPDREEALSVLRRVFPYVSITKPSLDDAMRIFGPGKTPEQYIDLFHEMGPAHVVLTLGADGLILSEKGRFTSIPAHSLDVVDATGAGDAFWAAFLVALLDGNSLERCALFAREIVTRKLSVIGPLPDAIDRQAVYAALNSAA